MNRRELLKRASAVAAVGAAAGCVSGDGDGGGSDDETTTEDSGGETTGAGETTAGGSDEATTAETATATATETETVTDTATPDRTPTPTTTAKPGARTPHPGSAPIPEGVVDRTVTDEGGCRSSDLGTEDASIEFRGDGGTVAVSGHFSTPVPCFYVNVDDDSYDDGVYEVSLVPIRQGTEEDPVACTQCTGRVDYQLTVEFESPPDTVVVRHGQDAVAKADN